MPTLLFILLLISQLLHRHFHSLHSPVIHLPSALLEIILHTQEWDQIRPCRMGYQGLLILQPQARTSMGLLLVVSLVLVATPVHVVTTVVQKDGTLEVLEVTTDVILILILITLVTPGLVG